MVDECCQIEASRKLEQLYPNRKDLFGTAGVDHLERIANDLGPITQLMLDTFILRTIDDPGFLNANIVPITCANQHKRMLIVVGMRLYLFIWRTNMLVADAWELDETRELVLKEDTDWPSKVALDELADSVLQYFGVSDLADTDFQRFNASVFSAHPVALLMQTEIVNMAEFFVLCHELQHVIPISQRALHFPIQSDESLPPDRADSWLEELQADADALYLLLVAAIESYKTRFNLPLEKAKEVAALTVFSGADAAMHALQTLERIRIGNVSQDRWGEAMFRTHPPADYRLKFLSLVGNSLGQYCLNSSSWELVRHSIASLSHVRQQLFDGFLEQRGDIVSEVRDI